jgi:glycerol-3-phosphate O-acyltransferase
MTRAGVVHLPAVEGQPDAVPVVLCLAGTRPERKACESWAQEQWPGGVRFASTPRDAVAAADPDALVVPVRVIRLGRGVAKELAARWLPRRDGDLHVVMGAPDRLGELRSRWSERSGRAVGVRPADDRDFVDFVGRQAAIVLERSERALRGDRYRTPQGVIDEVLTSHGFTDAVTSLSARLGRAEEGVLSDVRAYLGEMASKQDRIAVDLWARWARFLWAGGYRLEVEEEGLARVRALAAEHPLVFLPSHRSNLDPYVMASVLHDNGLPLNHTLGGINMAFWPIGSIGRRVGVVFIRRSFRDNDVYRFVLQRYLGFLVSKRFNLEWYIEGTRSRTGKLLPPKLGLLNYLVDAVSDLEREDVYAIPTSITYDVLPEASDMTAESRGSVKHAEGLGWLVRYARKQRGDLGAVHVRFGEPLKLAAISADDRLARSKLAFEVCVRINRASVITGSALLLFALLGVEGRALTLDEVCEVAAPVVAYAERRRIPLDRRACSLRARVGVEETLGFLVHHGLVGEFLKGPQPVYRIEPDQELTAAFYRNSILHWFVTRAIVELVMMDLARTESDGDLLRRGNLEAWRLRDLLKFEFFFPERAEFDEALAGEMQLIDEHWRARGEAPDPRLQQALVDSGMLVAHRTLRSFVEAYLVVAEHLVAMGESPADTEAVVRDCILLGRQLLLQRRLASDEAVSAHLFRTAVKVAEHRGLMGSDALARRQAFVSQLRDVLCRVEQVHDLDRGRAS